MEEEYSREKTLELRDLAREAFRKSRGIKDGDAVSFNHRDYTTLDVAFLWWFKKMAQDLQKEECAKIAESYKSIEGRAISAQIRSMI